MDGYELGPLIGRGTFGDVHKATGRKTGREVAIKIIDRSRLGSRGARERLKREVQIHGQLRHKHIVSLLDFFEDASKVYLVMEMCEKGEMLTLVRRKGSLAEEEARAYFQQLVDAIGHLHAHSIMHRDIKLANLLLTGDNDLKVADFGLAAILEKEDSERQTLCGTPNYLSPEIATNKPYSFGADIWSMGIVLWTMLVGTPPFQEDQVSGTLDRVRAGTFTCPHWMSVHACNLLQGMLHRDPTQRFSMRQVREHPFLAGLGIFQPHLSLQDHSNVLLPDEGSHSMGAQPNAARDVAPSQMVLESQDSRKSSGKSAPQTPFSAVEHKRPGDMGAAPPVHPSVGTLAVGIPVGLGQCYPYIPTQHGPLEIGVSVGIRQPAGLIHADDGQRTSQQAGWSKGAAQCSQAPVVQGTPAVDNRTMYCPPSEAPLMYIASKGTHGHTFGNAPTDSSLLHGEGLGGKQTDDYAPQKTGDAKCGSEAVKCQQSGNAREASPIVGVVSQEATFATAMPGSPSSCLPAPIAGSCRGNDCVPPGNPGALSASSEQMHVLPPSLMQSSEFDFHDKMSSSCSASRCGPMPECEAFYEITGNIMNSMGGNSGDAGCQLAKSCPLLPGPGAKEWRHSTGAASVESNRTGWPLPTAIGDLHVGNTEASRDQTSLSGGQRGEWSPTPKPSQLRRLRSTARLTPCVRRYSRGFVALFEDGSVCVNEGTGCAQMFVTPDGLEIRLECTGKSCQRFRFPDLPDHATDQYLQACRFVDDLAAEAVKVIYLSPVGRATMMENGDVVLAFLDCQPLEGYRSIRLKAGHPEEVDITMADGRQRTIVAHRDQGLAVQGDPAYRLAVGHVVSCKQKCNRVCEHAAAAQASGASVKFPLVARCRIPSSQT